MTGLPKPRRHFPLPADVELRLHWTADPKSFNVVYDHYPYDFYPIKDVAVVVVQPDLPCAVLESRGRFYFWDGENGYVRWIVDNDVKSVVEGVGYGFQGDWIFRDNFRLIPKDAME